MTKTFRTLLSINVIIIFCVVSCASKPEMKKQGQAIRDYGKQYLLKGDYTSALRQLLKAEKLYPNDPYLHDYLGQVYIGKKRLDLAIAHFKKALKLNPDYAIAKNNLGVAYMKKKEWDAAIATFEEVSENLLYETPQYPLLNLGSAYYHKKKYNLADKYFKQALSYYYDGFPKDAGYLKSLIGLGRNSIAKGNVSSAVKTLEKAVAFAPKDPKSYYYLAKAYSLSHNYKKAINAYYRAIELSMDENLIKEAKKEVKKIKFLQ